MMLMRQNTCPVNYSLCNQTVTVYHKDGDTITRKVYPVFSPFPHG